MRLFKESMQSHWRTFWGILPLMFLMSSQGYASYMYKGLEFTPSASVQEGYDDNITYVKNDPISDAVTQLAAELGIKQEEKTQTFSLDTKIEEELFAQHSSFDNTAEYLNLLFNKDISEYDQLKVTDVFSHAVEPTSFQNAFGSVSGRYFTYHNTLNLSDHYDLNAQWALNFRYSNDILDFSTSSLSDSSLNTVGTGLAYTLNSVTVLSTDYDYNNRTFYPGSSAVENEISENLRRYLTRKLYLDLRSGVNLINSYNGQNYIQPLYKASLTDELDENTKAGIAFVKQYTTTGYTQALFNSWQISANYTKNLTSRISAGFDVFYGDGDYIATNIQETYTGASIDASYELTQKAKLTLSYTFSKDDSTSPTDSYTKNVVDLGFSYEF